MLCHQLLRRNETLTTGVAGVRNILLFGKFVPGQFYLVCIDNYYIVAAVYVWGELWLGFSTDDHCDPRRQAPQNLAIRVNNNPLFVNGFFVSRDSFVT